MERPSPAQMPPETPDAAGARPEAAGEAGHSAEVVGAAAGAQPSALLQTQGPEALVALAGPAGADEQPLPRIVMARMAHREHREKDASGGDRDHGSDLRRSSTCPGGRVPACGEPADERAGEDEEDAEAGVKMRGAGDAVGACKAARRARARGHVRISVPQDAVCKKRPIVQDCGGDSVSGLM